MTNPDKNIILQVKNLKLAFGKSGEKEVLHDVNFSLKKNRITGMTGHSGSGKSLTALMIPGLVDKERCIYSGDILFNNDGEFVDLTGLSEREYQKIRGSKISMVFQDPYSSFDQRIKCGDQLTEVLLNHSGRSKKDSISEARKHFKKFGLNDRIFDSYPHEVSGGELQRVAFAIALAPSPELLIADEPVTNLDAISKKEILDLIKEINQKEGLTILYISHDIGSIRYLTDDILLMKSGKIEKINDENDYLSTGRSLIDTSVNDDNVVNENKTVLEIKNVWKIYKKNSIFKIFSSPDKVVALRDINISLNRGERLGIVGESGSGKTTLARILTGLERADSGEYLFEGKNFTSAGKKDVEYLRKNIQMVYQNPANSLNPLISNKTLIHEPFEVLGLHLTKTEKQKRIKEVLSKLNLDLDILNRYPRQLSGGEAQRFAIARVLLLEPKVMIFDEAVSSLDIQNQYDMLNNLLQLQKDNSLSYIYISHDLALTRQFCQKIIIMKDGEIIESGNSEDIFNNPKAEYTKKLLNAVF